MYITFNFYYNSKATLFSTWKIVLLAVIKYTNAAIVHYFLAFFVHFKTAIDTQEATKSLQGEKKAL